MSRSAINRLSVVAGALSSDPRDAARLSRLAGFRGVLFDAYSSSLSIPELSQTGRREFLRTLESQDQALVGFQLDLGPKGLGPGADVDRQIARLGKVLEAAAAMAAPVVCVDLGPLPAPTRTPKPGPAIKPESAGLIIIPEPAASPEPQVMSPPPDPAFVAQVNSALVQIGSLADRYSATVAFSSSLAGFASLSEALSAAGCPWFGVDLDPVAILRDDWDVDEIFSELGQIIRHVRVRDAVLGQDRRVKPAPVGRGDTKWSELLSALEHAGYGGAMTIDSRDLPDPAAAASFGARYLRLLLT